MRYPGIAWFVVASIAVLSLVIVVWQLPLHTTGDTGPIRLNSGFGSLPEDYRYALSKMTQADSMYPEEQEKFLEMAKLLRDWRAGKLAGESLHEALNRGPGRLEGKIQPMRSNLVLGESPTAVLVLQNLSHMPQTVFPFKVAIDSTRTSVKDGIRTDVIVLLEDTERQGHLHVIPANGSVVVPVVLPPQPVGCYRADIAATIDWFIDPSGKRIIATWPQLLVRDTVSFNVGQQ